MSDPVTCPTCGAHLGRGSTFCLKCGTKIESAPPLGEISELHDTTSPDDHLEESLLEDMAAPVEVSDSTDDATLPDLNESELPEPIPPAEATLPPSDLSWDETEESSPEEDYEPIMVAEVDDAIHEFEEVASIGMDEVKEGMPFREVAPPRVVDPEFRDETDEALEHLFPDESERTSVQAVTHLFPEGRGTATTDFIDAVVGKPDKVGVSVEMPELALSGDDFDYPPYVYEAMGKARIEHGDSLIKQGEHDRAIEQYEMAKKIVCLANNEKMLQDIEKRIDTGYEAKAEAHFQLGEKHLKAQEYEWSIVQYRKAREFFMFTKLAKMRAKCAEKVRDAYSEWGKALENEGDGLVKAGKTREALVKYKQASEKYTEADDRKKLRGLEKKIRKA
jgi:tetratricopeptide (TPR) repeat protein